MNAFAAWNNTEMGIPTVTRTFNREIVMAARPWNAPGKKQCCGNIARANVRATRNNQNSTSMRHARRRWPSKMRVISESVPCLQWPWLKLDVVSHARKGSIIFYHRSIIVSPIDNEKCCVEGTAMSRRVCSSHPHSRMSLTIVHMSVKQVEKQMGELAYMLFQYLVK